MEATAIAKDLGFTFVEAVAELVNGVAGLARGDHVGARDAFARAWDLYGRGIGMGDVGVGLWAEADLSAGDVEAARSRADEAVGRTREHDLAWQLGWALAARARVAVADGQPERAEDLAHEALAVRTGIGDKCGIADTLELLASLASGQESHGEAARLLAAADAVRQRIGYVRFEIYRDWHGAVVAAVRSALGDDDFARAWAEGAALTMDEAAAYATRGRGERKRPSSGWASLTPTELDVVRLVGEGLGNRDIAGRLFISPRTVQAHLTHIYSKTGVASRLNLAQEATRRHS